MIVQGVPPTPPAIVQPAPIRVAAWSLPQLGPDDVTLGCQMSFAAPLVARHFQIRYSTSAGRAAIGNFEVAPNAPALIYAHHANIGATQLELNWVVPDIPAFAPREGPSNDALYTASVPLAGGEIFVSANLESSRWPRGTTQSRGTCQVVP